MLPYSFDAFTTALGETPQLLKESPWRRRIASSMKRFSPLSGLGLAASLIMTFLPACWR
jgi:hypothetical protein